MGCEVSSFDGVAKDGETGAVRRSIIETSGRSSSTWMCSFAFVGSGSEATTGILCNAAPTLSPIPRRGALRAHSASRRDPSFHLPVCRLGKYHHFHWRLQNDFDK